MCGSLYRSFSLTLIDSLDTLAVSIYSHCYGVIKYSGNSDKGYSE